MKKTLLLAAIGLFLGSALTPASAFADDKPKKEKKKKSKKNKEPEFVIEKAELKDGGDSLAYIFGVWQTNGLKDYMAGQLGVDTAYIQDFSRGIIDRVSIDPADQKMKAYLAGQQIANQIEQMANQISKDYYSAQPDKKISPKIIANAIVLSLMGKDEMSVDSAQAVFQKTMEKRQEENKETLYGENRRTGEQWLAENKKKEGVITLPSGLQYKILTKGNGPVPTANQKVKVNYEGHLIDGTEFDSSYKRNQPSSFRCNQVIKGWTEALCKMPVGSKWELYIPYDLAYGDRDTGKIKPYSTLIFTVELLGIEE